MTLLSRACVRPYYSISLKLCLYVEPFMIYSASKNGATLNLKVGSFKVIENAAVR